MALLRFMEQFPDEDSCRSHLREVREKRGVVCKKCTGKKHYWPRDNGNAPNVVSGRPYTQRHYDGEQQTPGKDTGTLPWPS